MIDLFEHYDKLPPEIRRIIFSWDKSADPCQECERLLYELKPHGYTFDYGLD